MITKEEDARRRNQNNWRLVLFLIGTMFIVVGWSAMQGASEITFDKFYDEIEPGSSKGFIKASYIIGSITILGAALYMLSLILTLRETREDMELEEATRKINLKYREQRALEKLARIRLKMKGSEK